MPYFQVATEELTAAGGMVAASDGDMTAGQAALVGSSGAADGTPAAAALGSFINGAQTAASSAHDAVSSLAPARQEAAAAYSMADSSSATSYTMGRG